MGVLKELRKKYNYSQEEIANKIGTSQSNYSKYEKGSLELSVSQALKLADLYDCSIDELVGNEKKTNTAIGPNKAKALELFEKLDDNDYLLLIGYIQHILMEKEQKQKQRINTLISNINREV